VDDGERERAGQAAARRPAAAGPPPKPTAADYRQNLRDQRKSEKELKNLEKKIARLDDEKRQLSQQMMSETNPQQALQLHTAFATLERELQEAEERWLELNENL
jgi:ATP-binding cassette subfamily F protein 3